MKKFSLMILSFLLTTGLFAQELDRSIRPEPGPAREIKIGDYKSFTLDNGLQVFVVENSKLPRVSISLSLDYDPIMEGAKAGYVDIAGQMLKRGTKKRDKATLDNEIDFMGASLSAYSSGGFASGLSKHFDKLAELLSDVIINPTFPEDEFNKIIRQSLSGLEAAKDQASFMMSNVTAKRLFGPFHPYGEVETEETLNNIQLTDCINFHNSYFKPNIAYMAVVGDVKFKDVEKIIRKHFGEWEKGDVPAADYPAPPRPRIPQVSLVNRDASVQSSVKVANTYNLKPGDDDAIAVSLANTILGGGSLGRLFLNLREDKAYTYGAYSSAGTDQLTARFSATAEVRNEVTDSAIAEILGEISKMRDELVPEKELQNAKNYISGNFGLSLESPQTIARFAINTARYNLPADYYQNYLKKLNALTAADIQNIAKKYFEVDRTHILVVGKAADIAESLSRFGAVNYYDIYGEKAEAPNLPIPDGVTLKVVLDKHFDAQGGRKKASKIKTFDQTAEGEIPGQGVTLVLRTRKINGKAFLQETSVEGMGVVQSSIYDGKVAKIKSVQGDQELEGDELKAFANEAYVFKVLALENAANTTLKLERMSIVNGVPAYVVAVMNGETGKNTGSLYFDSETYHLIKEDSNFETEQGDMTTSLSFSDFQKVDGFIIPMTLTQDLGGMKITMKATETTINGKIDKKIFTIK
ncbi:MAG: insulinase family protein [Schleiferiaceae bacterium]|nr:insulinase family protein [Schleiferiaceae bacterium]